MSSLAAHSSAPGQPPVAGLMVGERYRLDRLLATGGTAQVWSATDTVLARSVAVKLLSPLRASDPDFVQRFRREAIAAGRIVHPNVVAVYDTCRDPEAIVLELVEGPSLREVLDEQRFMPAADAVRIATSVCDALDAAHRGGVVHRDVKPGNILCDDGRIRVTDFGIAKAAEEGDADLTRDGTLVGTAKYLAPEQVEGGPVDARTDVYALGAVLFEMVCGRPPFIAEPELACALERCRRDAPRARQVLPSVPADLDTAIARALERDPDDRWCSAADFRAALQAVELGPAAATLTEPPDATLIDQPVYVRDQRTWLVPTLVVMLVAASLGVAAALIGSTGAGHTLLERVSSGTLGDPPVEVAPAEIAAPASFDPEGRGIPGENDGQLRRAVDGDPETFWQSEGYEDLATLKSGVGYVLRLDRAQSLHELEIESVSNDWDATVHVGPGGADELADWGEPVARLESVGSGTTSVALEGDTGSAVLIWFTDLGDEPPLTHVRINELRLTQRL